MHLHYGVVSLRGRPWTQASETLRGFVLDAEEEATQLEQRLREAHGPESAPLHARTSSATSCGKRASAGRLK
jgi:hypothetical protein